MSVMNKATTLLAVALMASGCQVRVRTGVYAYGGFATSYWARTESPHSAQLDYAVTGSDGTYGWRVPVLSPPAALHRFSEMAAHSGCEIRSSVATETRASCSGVNILIRTDSENVYKLCEQGTLSNACSATWARIGR